MAPIQVKIKIVATKNQNLIFLVGLNFVGLDFSKIKGARIRIERARATTPPSFEGIDRKIT